MFIHLHKFVLIKFINKAHCLLAFVSINDRPIYISTSLPLPSELPSLQDIYTRRCTRKAKSIIKDSSHPSHRLLSLLPSGRRLRSIRSRTSRLRDSFFPQANEQSEITHLHHTPTHTTCHALHFNTVLSDYTHTLP